jgi:hypothetical protein
MNFSQFIEWAYKIKLTKDKFALVDKDDFERLSKFNWHTSGCSGSSVLFYAARSRWDSNSKIKKTILMHREIINPKEGFVVDHINGNGLDNRRSNLRICSKAENQRNMKRNVRNTSGYKGVSFFKRDNKWRSSIRINGKEKNLGHYVCKIEAYAAYLKASKEYFGEFRRSHDFL